MSLQGQILQANLPHSVDYTVSCPAPVRSLMDGGSTKPTTDRTSSSWTSSILSPRSRRNCRSPNSSRRSTRPQRKRRWRVRNFAFIFRLVTAEIGQPNEWDDDWALLYANLLDVFFKEDMKSNEPLPEYERAREILLVISVTWSGASPFVIGHICRAACRSAVAASYVQNSR